MILFELKVKLCPHLIFVKSDFKAYGEAAAQASYHLEQLGIVTSNHAS